MANAWYILVVVLWAVGSMIGQEVVFKVEVTTDSLYYGNPLGIKYTIENTQGDFEPPEFEGFEIVGGPNVSSQFSMINGSVSQSASYEYILMPIDLGSAVIAPAIVKNGQEVLESNDLSILVLDNPDGIRQGIDYYGVSSARGRKGGHRVMTAADSLKMRLKKVKARKI